MDYEGYDILTQSFQGAFVIVQLTLQLKSVVYL